MTAPPNLKTGAAILETAAHLLAEHDASMSEIAAAAGVGRATLYRHYPTREALLAALAAQALDELADRIGNASLENTTVPEAIERLARVLLTVADRYVVLVRERVKPNSEDAYERVGQPMRTLFERGAREGILRTDLTPDAQIQLFASNITNALHTNLHRELGIDQTAAILTSYFLNGARTQQHS
jgi:TetR/AcrR family transcriptional repressor of mexCD-oprJ operon